MNDIVAIDVDFDMRSDANGRDPDRYSPTLREYHRVFWSKPLPNGERFELSDAWPQGYLKHESELGSFRLTSDTILRTFVKHSKMQHIIQQIPPEQRAQFSRRGYTIGGFLVFPGNKIDNKYTINQARGVHPRIEDRIDLTLECIRRHYRRESSPLAEALARYTDFFALFGDFRGYVEFFLLQDLVTEDSAAVRFFLPFEGFRVTPALPENLGDYLEFRESMLTWIERRNQRIAGAVALLNAAAATTRRRATAPHVVTGGITR